MFRQLTIILVEHGDYTSALNNYINFVKEATGFGENVTVYATSLIGVQNASSTNVNNFNKKVEEKVDGSEIKYIDIKPDNVQHTDGVHFTSDTTNKIHDKIENSVSSSNGSSSNKKKKKKSRGSYSYDSTGKYIIDIKKLENFLNKMII